MKYCPINLEPIDAHESYSRKGLNSLAPKLRTIAPLALTLQALKYEAALRADKMSVQGVQTKLSAILNVKQGYFEIVSTKGTYILKPQNELYPELPENEALTMTLAAKIGIEVPPHGLVQDADGHWVYFVKRFDRLSRGKKCAQEDFSQLLNLGRDSKYAVSTEHMLEALSFASAPAIESVKLFKLMLFNFLVGNEDAHLKNFSLITRKNQVTLSPAYDLVNSSIAIAKPKEEIALSLNGKRTNLKQHDLIDYLGRDRLGLTDKVIDRTLDTIRSNLPIMQTCIDHSFLSTSMKENYLALIQSRWDRLQSS